MKSTRKVIAIILPVISILLVVVWTLLLLFVITRYFKYIEVKEGEMFEYQQLTFDPLTNEKTYGIVKIFDHIWEGEGIYYENVLGKHVLISNFGSQQFVCHGSCSCEASDQRRNLAASSKAINGLIYLVTAAVSFLAINQAREYYRKRCYDILSDSCPLDSIVGSVDHCKSETDGDDVENEAKEFDEDEPLVEDDIPEYLRDPFNWREEDFKDYAGGPILDDIMAEHDKLRKRKWYKCVGKCLNKDFEDFTDYDFYRELEGIDLSKYEVKCQDFELEAEIQADISGAKPSEYAQRAWEMFDELTLQIFCRRKGWKKIPYEIPWADEWNNDEDQNIEFDGYIDMFFCDSRNEFYQNPTHTCVPMDTDEDDEKEEEDGEKEEFTLGKKKDLKF